MIDSENTDLGQAGSRESSHQVSVRSARRSDTTKNRLALQKVFVAVLAFVVVSIRFCKATCWSKQIASLGNESMSYPSQAGEILLKLEIGSGSARARQG